MDWLAVSHLLRDVSILFEPTQDTQLVASGQCCFGTFQATTSDPVEDKTRSGSVEPARRQCCISSLHSAAIRHDNPQEPVGRGRELPLQRTGAVPYIDDDHLVICAGRADP